MFSASLRRDSAMAMEAASWFETALSRLLTMRVEERAEYSDLILVTQKPP